MQVLNVSRNPNIATKRSMSELKSALSVNNSLKVLIMESVGLASETAIILGETLSASNGLETLILTGNDAALNPLRTDLLNMEQNLKAYGQKAIRSVTQGLNKAFSSINRGNGDADAASPTSPPVFAGILAKPSVPTASDVTRSTLDVFLAALRQNRKMINLSILTAEDSMALGKVSPESKLYQFRELFEAMQQITRRNRDSIANGTEAISNADDHHLLQKPADAFTLE